MTTLEDRPNSALLVIDVQSDVVGGAHERDSVVANIGNLVDRARGERVPVIWVQHSDEGLIYGSAGWRIVPELQPGEDELLIEKNHGDSFEATTLETELADLGVGRLVVVAPPPMRASAPRSTGRSSGATTSPSSPTRTRRRT